MTTKYLIYRTKYSLSLFSIKVIKETAKQYQIECESTVKIAGTGFLYLERINKFDSKEEAVKRFIELIYIEIDELENKIDSLYGLIGEVKHSD